MGALLHVLHCFTKHATILALSIFVIVISLVQYHDLNLEQYSYKYQDVTEALYQDVTDAFAIGTTLQKSFPATAAALIKKNGNHNNDNDIMVGRQQQQQQQQQQSDNHAASNAIMTSSVSSSSSSSSDNTNNLQGDISITLAPVVAMLDDRQQEEEDEEKKAVYLSKAYTFEPDNDYDPNNASISLNIRSWGCDRRHEAPFIFVHIGKAGGGSIRARLAASALDYNRQRWEQVRSDNTYYYPMKEQQQFAATATSATKNENTNNNTNNGTAATIHRGQFFNSAFPNFRPSYPKTNDNFTKDDMERADNSIWKTYESTMPCGATTPLGQAVACPIIRKTKLDQACNDRRCNVVSMGHSLLGNEMHWLTSKYLEEWWKTTPWSLSAGGDAADSDNLQQQSSVEVDLMQRHWRGRYTRWLNPNATITTTVDDDDERGQSSELSCHAPAKRGDGQYQYYRTNYFDCVAPYEDDADKAATAMVDANIRDNQDWSHLYASLPLLRATMMREPFSWLVSKFFWHRSNRLVGRNGTFVIMQNEECDDPDFERISNWAGPAIVKLINHLCGEDCLVRDHLGMMTLAQLERQARHNLQHSFAVVGLLNETDTFFEMITARVGYMNTSLNPEVTGAKHSTAKNKEYQRCSDIYKQSDFQVKLLAACPELAAVQRLFQVAILVNRHQMQEMQTCGWSL